MNKQRTWSKREKDERNANMYAYYVAHPEANYEKIGKEFRISTKCAWVIIQRFINPSK